MRRNVQELLDQVHLVRTQARFLQQVARELVLFCEAQREMTLRDRRLAMKERRSRLYLAEEEENADGATSQPSRRAKARGSIRREVPNGAEFQRR